MHLQGSTTGQAQAHQSDAIDGINGRIMSFVNRIEGITGRIHYGTDRILGQAPTPLADPQGGKGTLGAPHTVQALDILEAALDRLDQATRRIEQ